MKNAQATTDRSKKTHPGKEIVVNVKTYAVAMLTTGVVLVGSLLAYPGGALSAPVRPKAAKAKAGGATASAGNSVVIALGKKVYDKGGCATCHAISGKGGSSGPDLTNTGGPAEHTPQWLAVQVANPKAHNPDSTMPPFASSIQGKDLTAIGAYLASLKSAGAGGAPDKPASSGGGAKISPAVLAKIEGAHGMIGPLAQNDDHLEVSFHMAGPALTDSALSSLNGLKNVVHLDLGQTGVTDSGLAVVKNLKDLTELHLEGTKVTDAGLVSLEGLKNLTYLNLFNTAVTDAGMEHLTKLTNLKHLYVWQTKVTDVGVAKLKKAIPQLDVVQGWDTAPAAPATPKK